MCSQAVERKELRLKLTEIFRKHPRETIDDDQTKVMFAKLRDIATNMSISMSIDPDAVDIVGTDAFVRYFLNYIDLVTEYLDNFDVNDFICVKIKNLIVLQMTLWNVTDKSSGVCSRLVLADAHKKLWEFVDHKKLRSSLKFRNAGLLVNCTLGILHNISRLNPLIRGGYRECGAVDILLPYVSVACPEDDTGSSISLQTAALFILGNIVNENEQISIVKTDSRVLEFILSALGDALRSAPDYYSTSYGYHAVEIFGGLNCLAGNDENKKSLLFHNALASIADALKISIDVKHGVSASGASATVFSRNEYRFYSDDLAREAIDLLWHLSLLEETRDQLKETSELYKLCQQCNGSEWATECHKSVQALLSSLSQSRNCLNASGKLDTSAITSSPKPQGHIMISYNNTSQNLVVKLKEALTQRGWNVWIYTEHCSELLFIYFVTSFGFLLKRMRLNFCRTWILFSHDGPGGC